MNLRDETIAFLAQNGKDLEDVAFIGSLETGESLSVREFLVLSNREYDNGFGGQEVRSDLVLVFKNRSQMVRREYDGAEWWEFIPVPRIPRKTKPMTYLYDENQT